MPAFSLSCAAGQSSAAFQRGVVPLAAASIEHVNLSVASRARDTTRPDDARGVDAIGAEVLARLGGLT